ncbi:hypothetical protein [Alistipes putredinis]|uniref:hypothetical protein n=1 Tax=Alistipes putredinis TaxID=28117 RepID=UPI003F7C18B4
MDFSHLADTGFPNIGTVAPYELRNTFDYTRWTPDTRIHMVNVPWDSEYENAVKFDSDTDRDAWFDSIEDSYTITLRSNARIIPDGSIKLPLPYDVASRYNYLFVDIPIATSEGEPIQNETESGVRRWYFFVGNAVYSAPNTTTVYIQPDVWTNFINSSVLRYMMLERGHAPVYATDVDRYLSNPIENNRYLLAPDVNYDDTDVVRDSAYMPVGSGSKLVVFASTTGVSQIDSGASGTVGPGQTYSKPTYSDTADWYGYQLQVNGYNIGNGLDYTNLKACVSQQNEPDGMVPTSLEVYAVPASDATFLADVASKSPAFLRTIKALFIVSDDMVLIRSTHRLCGHTVYRVSGTRRTIGTYELTRDKFGFDGNEDTFAKLYTYPYSRIEVSDGNGHTSEVRIESTTGRLGMELLVSVAFPVLDSRVYLTGVGGSGSNSYVWKSLDGMELRREVPKGDWDRLLFSFDIPTFALYMDAETGYMLDGHSSRFTVARENALTSYHRAVRSANLGRANDVASADTAHSNSTRDAGTAQTNANVLAETTRTNANNMAAASRDNTNATIAAASANTQVANSASVAIMTNGNTAARWDTNDTNLVSISTTETNNQTAIATTKNTNDANMSGSAMQGAVSGAMAGHGDPLMGTIGAIAGGVTGYVTAGISAQAATSNATITTQAAEDVTHANINSNNNIVTRHIQIAQQNTETQNESRTDQTNNNNAALGTQRDNNYSTATTNAANAYNASVGNSGRTHDTAVADADATNSTSIANADRTREVGVLNAKETLETMQDESMAGLYDARSGAPTQLTEVTGDGTGMCYGMNGLQVRLRTQSKSAIAQTADQFARYGYALEQVWDVEGSGLNLMKHFTYWKADDIWVDVRNVASADVGATIRSIFRNGVTVWRDPNDIGKVGIYDN